MDVCLSTPDFAVYVEFGGCCARTVYNRCCLLILLNNKQEQVTNLERLMIKIGVYSVLYIVPALCVLACNIYHLHTLLQWTPTTTHYVSCLKQADDDIKARKLCNTRPPMPSVGQLV